MTAEGSRSGGGGEDDVLRSLGELGLTSKQARAYVALMRVAPATASEVADAAGISRPKVYEVLKSLEQQGFSYVRGDRVARWHAVDAEVALGELARRREQERQSATARDEQLVAGLREALPAPAGEDDLHDSRFMRARVGAEATLEMLVDIVGRAERRLDIVVTTPVIQQRSEWHLAELGALARGVSVRVIYGSDLVDDPERYRPLLEAGAEVRQSSNLPLKMIVRDDGAEAVVSLVDSSDGEFVAMSVLVGQHELVAPFQLLFNRQWRQASELAADPPASPALRS